MTEAPRQQCKADPEPHVLILMAMYRSDPRFLADQLESLAEQQHGNWSLLVSDDGPTEAATRVLDDFAARHPDRDILRRQGPARGFAANFLSMIGAVPAEVPFAALADHDDVWFPDRLTRGLRALAEVPAGVPAVACARTRVCDADLRPIGTSGLFTRPPCFANALAQSIGGGNTMLLNRAALDLLAAAGPEAGEIVAHDWWIYQIVSGAGGRILYDPEPTLLYRQHGRNLIGSNLAARAQFDRLGQLLGGRYRRWHDVNLAALGRSAHRLTPEARETLAAFAEARRGLPWRRLAALRRSGIYRQTRLGNLALVMACLTGRL